MDGLNVRPDDQKAGAINHTAGHTGSCNKQTELKDTHRANVEHDHSILQRTHGDSLNVAQIHVVFC